MENKDKKQYIINYEDAIAYAVSSGNATFAITVATTAKKNGRVHPGLLDLYYEGNEACAYAYIKNFFYAIYNIKTIDINKLYYIKYYTKLLELPP